MMKKGKVLPTKFFVLFLNVYEERRKKKEEKRKKMGEGMDVDMKRYNKEKDREKK